MAVQTRVKNNALNLGINAFGLWEQKLFRKCAAVTEPNPGTPPGALKSHEFSDKPMKSRITGSADQARRSAARAKSAGTPAARKARMSAPAPIDSIGGKLAGSKGGRVSPGGKAA